MPTVTGSLYDVGMGHLAGLNPEVIFTLNGPNVLGSGVIATRPQVATVAGSGAFTTVLADTTAMRRDAWYTMSVRWQEPGVSGVTGYSPVDVHIDAKLIVPAAGGPIGDLIVGGVTNLSLVYISLAAPVFKIPLMLWYKTNPDNPADPANTGNIYRWENI